MTLGSQSAPPHIKRLSATPHSSSSSLRDAQPNKFLIDLGFFPGGGG